MINWNIYIAECIGMVILFTAMIMIPLCKNPIWWIHDYPEDIREEYFKTHERIPTKMLSPTVAIKKGFALILALGIMTLLMAAAGAHSFLSAFLMSYGIWLIIDWYDCFFLDWVLFANIKRVRLPGTEHMDKEYHQKKYHVVHSVMGMGLGLIPCLLCGLIFAINPNYEDYEKPFHYLLSPSSWLDLDSFIYIVAVSMIVFCLVRIVAKCKGKKGINIIDFLAKFMILCSLPVFLLFFVQLALSGQWRWDNIIVCILPILYGVVIQLIFKMIRQLI